MKSEIASSGEARLAMTKKCRLVVREANPNVLAVIKIGVRTSPPTCGQQFNGGEKYSGWEFTVELSRLEQITSRTDLLIDKTAVGTNQP